MLISKEYAALNAQLHADVASYGTSAGQFVQFVHGLVVMEKYATVLDYGCGKGLLKAMLPQHPIAEYDPAIEGKTAMPAPAELVCCFDVLEHIEPHCLNPVLRHLRSLTQRKFVFNISTRPAAKFLADGRNAHLSLHNEQWWRRKLLNHFQIVTWEVREGSVYGEALPLPKACLWPENLLQRRRRPITPQLAFLFQLARDNSRKYGDALHRIETIETWEGRDDDKPADMVVAINIIEHCADVDAALHSLVRLARLSVMVCMPLPAEETIWRHVFERRLRVVDWMVEELQGEKRLIMCGSPAVEVQGIKPVGAVESDTRWDNVLNSVKLHRQRIQPAPAHDKSVILCCYGPSIGEQLSTIKDRIAEGNCAIVSVSGAHDFLIDNGIVPRYHIECDPRPHKALNLRGSHPGVSYLIASCIHPDYWERLGPNADVLLWHIASAEHTQKLIDELHESSDHVVSGGGSVGLRALPLMHIMGYRKFHIFGMDSSFRDEGKQQWAGAHAGKRQDVVQVQCGERIFYSSPLLLTYASQFFEHVQKTTDCTYSVYGDSLLQAMCRLYAGLPQCADLGAEAA